MASSEAGTVSVNRQPESSNAARTWYDPGGSLSK